MTGFFIGRHANGVCLLVLMALLQACSTLRDDTMEWPLGLPPSAHFVTAYEQDSELHGYQSRAEYLSWVRKFYEGTSLYPQGWNAISENLLPEGLNSELAQAREQQLFLIGRAIATEWSKANEVRLIDSGSLSTWGVATGRAVDEGDVDETLAKIAEDVRGLLAGELSPDAIKASRYHEQDPDDWFSF